MAVTVSLLVAVLGTFGMLGPLGTAAWLASTPSAVATGVISSWLGVTLGEPANTVRSSLGRPRAIIPISVGELWRYEADNGNVTLELVMNDGAVANIAARLKSGRASSLADPMGGAIGMTAGALEKLRGDPLAVYDNGGSIAYGEPSGVRWFYTIDAGMVTGIELSQPLATPPPPQVISGTANDGSSMQKPFLIKAANNDDASAAALAFLQSLSCDATGAKWQPVSDQLLPGGGRFYRVYHVSCTGNKQPHDFYFDVTDAYGK